MRNCYKSILILLFVFLQACASGDKEAQQLLVSARQSYNKKEYFQAKLLLDSLNILHPKAFSQIKASLALLDSIRRAENVQIIASCDSLIASSLPILEKQKKLFVFQKNQKYQETGNYIPKESIVDYITGTAIRSGVEESGQLFIETVLVGGKQRHNRLRVSTKEGAFAESFPVEADGLNYRFSNMGKEYEIIRFAGADENGIAKFIYTNINKTLIASVIGQGQYTFTLSQPIKSAISKSFQLSVMMQQYDSLKITKEKAEYHIYYLDNRKREKAEGIYTK